MLEGSLIQESSGGHVKDRQTVAVRNDNALRRDREVNGPWWVEARRLVQRNVPRAVTMARVTAAAALCSDLAAIIDSCPGGARRGQQKRGLAAPYSGGSI